MKEWSVLDSSILSEKDPGADPPGWRRLPHRAIVHAGRAQEIALLERRVSSGRNLSTTEGEMHATAEVIRS